MSTTVFISGATGNIGQAVALAFRRAGYRVLGLARNEDKAKTLKQNEVHVCVGDITQLDKFNEQLKQADIIIDGVGQTGTMPLFDKTVSISSGKSRKPLFIGTSGLLSYGDSPNVLDETHEPKNVQMQSRIEIEKKIINSKDVRGVVVRPSMVYGLTGGRHAATAFSIKENEDLILYGRLDKRLNWVHVEDLADAYVRIAKVGHVVDGEIFDIAGPWIPTYQEWKVAAAKATGWKGKVVHITEIPKDNFMANIFEVNIVVSAQKAFNLLGWKENHLGFVAEIDTYYQSYKNSL